MAKKFDVYGLPWGGKMGKDVTDCKTSEEVIKKAGLDFGPVTEILKNKEVKK